MNIKECAKSIHNMVWIFLTIGLLLSSRENALPEVVMKTPQVHHTKLMRHPDSPEVVIPEPVKVSRKSAIPKRPPRYGFREDEIYLLTVLLCGSGKRDGDGEYDFDFGNQNNRQQITLVLSVVMNRVESSKFPDTVHKVVWAQNQFVYMPNWRNGLPKVKPESYAIVEEWCKAYDAWDPNAITIPKSHLYFSGNGTINRSSTRW